MTSQGTFHWGVVLDFNVVTYMGTVRICLLNDPEVWTAPKSFFAHGQELVPGDRISVVLRNGEATYVE